MTAWLLVAIEAPEPVVGRRGRVHTGDPVPAGTAVEVVEDLLATEGVDEYPAEWPLASLVRLPDGRVVAVPSADLARALPEPMVRPFRADLDGVRPREQVQLAEVRWADAEPWAYRDRRASVLVVEDPPAVSPAWEGHGIVGGWFVDDVEAREVASRPGRELVVGLTQYTPEVGDTAQRTVVLALRTGEPGAVLDVLLDLEVGDWPQIGEFDVGSVELGVDSAEVHGVAAQVWSRCELPLTERPEDTAVDRCLSGWRQRWTWDGQRFAPGPVERGLPVTVWVDGVAGVGIAVHGVPWDDVVDQVDVQMPRELVRVPATEVEVDDPQLAAWLGGRVR